jgi:hypothetical protein
MTQIGRMVDIGIFETSSEDPQREADGVEQYELTEHQVLPVGPPHGRLSLRDVDNGEPLVSGCWRYEAISDQVRRSDNAAGTGLLLINFLNVLEGEEDAVNTWFVEEHLPDLLALPGFISGQRFRAVAGQGLAYAFLNVWEVDPEPAIDSLRSSRAEREDAVRAGRQPKVRVHPSLIADQRMGGIYRHLEG